MELRTFKATILPHLNFKHIEIKTYADLTVIVGTIDSLNAIHYVFKGENFIHTKRQYGNFYY